MANYNKVLLMGNLTRDPELRYTAGGTAVASFGLAINRVSTAPDGTRREEVTFVDCEAWGKQAETISEYLRKGRPVFVEGRLRLDQWESQDGQKRSRLRVVCERFQFLDRGGAGAAPDTAGREGTPREAPPRRAAPEPAHEPEPPEPQDDQEIPF